jgi:2-hydroxychromene-2-carboxylate isomerase
MSKQVEFYFDYGSPNSYLAWTQLPDMCARHGAELAYKPMLLGGVFQATGNQTPVNIEAKGAWMMGDMARYAKKYDVTFVMNPYFIINTLPTMRGVFWAQKAGVFDAYNTAIQKAMWEDGVDMNNPEEIGRVVTAAGLDAAAMAEALQDGDIKKALIDATNEAAERGVFRAPTMFVDGEMHFGQDRLPWVEEALAR